ncbi:CBM_collapsed_G0036740.mRNA.1.CDS.1 [Saccharomyces cerevisiae]|nr:CBM_collapsed_G0036740.mRNA.1.CDS.1 [Saccharomyces cerevisiae]
MSSKISDLTSTQNKPLLVTQQLIEKYYEQILGTSQNIIPILNPKNKFIRPSKDNSDVERVQEDAGKRLQTGKNKTTNKVNFNLDTGNEDKLDDDQETVTENENNDIEMVETDEGEDERQGSSLASKCKSFLYNVFVGNYERDILIDKVCSQKQHAMSFEEWCSAGARLDDLTGKTEWKQKLESPLYDYKLIKDLTSRMREERLNRNYAQLLYIIRTNWVRNLGNMGNVNLYRHSHVGTKYLIDEYMMESRLALESLMESDLDDSYLLGILQQTRRNIGRTALVLSGGGTFGLFHIGVLGTLFELDLLPRVISGSSAGAIVASILSVHHKEEIPVLLNHILDKEFNIFKDDKQKSESENLLIKISRFFKNGTWFDNKHLVNTMIEFLGDLTFREAYNRTGKILNITVSPASLFEQPRLLNNLTAPNVLIWSAVCASCSLPGIFPSSPLYEKDPKTGERKPWTGSSSVKFVDGSVDNDLPISRLSEMFNVDHIIACQVNIHVFPFLKLSLSCVGGEIEDEFSARLKQNLSSIYNFMANEAIHILEIGSEMGIAKNALTKLRSVLSQQYSGDITILPDMCMLFRIKELLSNPTKEFLLREITNGAKATWPKVSIIQNHCGQEFALDKAISYIKGRMIVTSSLKTPFQFADSVIGLIKAPEQTSDESKNPENSTLLTRTPTKGDNHISNVLDDNLLESESTNSLLLLRENASTYGRSPSGFRPRYSITSASLNPRHQRRKSDTISTSRRPAKSFSFSVASPTSRMLRQSSKINGHPPPILQKKTSMGRLMFPMDAKTYDPESHELIPHSASIETPAMVDKKLHFGRKSRYLRHMNKKWVSSSNILYTDSDKEDHPTLRLISNFDSDAMIHSDLAGNFRRHSIDGRPPSQATKSSPFRSRPSSSTQHKSTTSFTQ